MSFKINNKALENLKETNNKIQTGQNCDDRMNNSLKYEELRINSAGNVFIVDSRTENNHLSYKNVDKLINSRR